MLLYFLLQAKHLEEIALKKEEVDRLDLLIVHSPERAAQEKAIMEEKVFKLIILLVVHRYCHCRASIKVATLLSSGVQW